MDNKLICVILHQDDQTSKLNLRNTGELQTCAHPVGTEHVLHAHISYTMNTLFSQTLINIPYIFELILNVHSHKIIQWTFHRYWTQLFTLDFTRIYSYITDIEYILYARTHKVYIERFMDIHWTCPIHLFSQDSTYDISLTLNTPLHNYFHQITWFLSLRSCMAEL